MAVSHQATGHPGAHPTQTKKCDHVRRGYATSTHATNEWIAYLAYPNGMPLGALWVETLGERDDLVAGSSVDVLGGCGAIEVACSLGRPLEHQVEDRNAVRLRQAFG
jgi:hypothetical protein